MIRPIRIAASFALLLGSCNPSSRATQGGTGGTSDEAGSGGGPATGGKPATGGAGGMTERSDASAATGGNSGGGKDSGAGGAMMADARPSQGGAPGDAGAGGGGEEPALQMFDSPCLSTPDPDVAAGPTLVGTAIQWNAYFFKRDGTMDHTYKWTALRGNLISDTHIVYDAPTKHWFMTTIVSLGGNSTGVQFMVSTDETASSWKLSIPIEMPRLIDDPQPTVTTDKVVITESGKCVWAIDKMALIAGNAPMVQSLTCNVAQNNQVAAIKFGPEPPATAYAITMADRTTVNWLSTEGPPATAKVTEHKLTVPMVDEVPLDGISQGGKAGLESGQVKAMWHDNHITWTKTVRCNGVTCIRHFDVDTMANKVTSTDYAVPNTQLFYGGSGFDKAGNAWVLMASSTKAGFVGLTLAGRRADGTIYAPKEVVKGLAAINGTGLIRFGDYFSGAMDPVDGSTWLIGQWAALDKASAKNGENNAACKVVKVTAK
jgi:hypothetical protein